MPSQLQLALRLAKSIGIALKKSALRHRVKLAFLGAFLLSLVILDRLFPIPQPGHDSFNVIVLASDGTPLRAFPDRAHIWRHPVTLNQVSPYYKEALITYEDKHFWWHIGVNPISLARAAYQWARYGRIISGGSTITMQVARILDPTPRTVLGKLKQIARALQLEAHYSKNEILTLYMNFAPMGGVLEGVETASRAYLGKPAIRLTHAEAALLTVLPQLPSVLRPDRNPEKAKLARDKVIKRLHSRWSTEIISDALTEPIAALTVREPLLAPLLAQRLKSQVPKALRIDSTINSAAQQTVESILLNRVAMLPPKVSMAAMVMDNRNGDVIAYAGSADFTDRERFSDVDMVRAARSPGSTLKPFLYAFALDEGLIHSESLLADIPQSFSGYQPGNFQQNFHGAVSVSESLVKSLNVPAVEVLDKLGSVPFVAMLRRGGLPLQFSKGAAPNLSVILGGVAVTMEDMIGAFSSIARKGIAISPRFIPQTPQQERRMMSEGAAFIVRDILETGGPMARAIEASGSYRGYAYKTGTSFGFRDAWSFGVSNRYTVGVWVGRPDGTPNPGFFGANIAAPLLGDIFNALPDGRNVNPSAPPNNVKLEKICWPSGTRINDVIDVTTANNDNNSLCPIQRSAWVLNGIAPPTFVDKLQATNPKITYYVDPTTNKRVLPDCAPHGFITRQLMRWPAGLNAWLDNDLAQKAQPPEWDKECQHLFVEAATPKIMGATHGEVIRMANGGKLPQTRLELRGAVAPIYWMVNGKLLGGNNAVQLIKFNEVGRYDITALDDHGNFDRITLSVQK